MPASPLLGIWAEKQWAFGWRNRFGSAGCPCSAHFVRSCGKVRKIKTDGNYTFPSARTSRWSRHPKMSKGISYKALIGQELHKSVLEHVSGFLLIFFFSFSSFLWWF
jgi:hypothetical protein